MLSGEARRAQERDPRKVRITFNGQAFEWRKEQHAAWDGNPRIAQPDDLGDFQDLAGRVNGLRPYAARKTRERWVWREYAPPPGEIYFTSEERDFGSRYAGRVILEPHIKRGASPNKEWGWVRWNKLAWLLGRRRVRVTQLGPHGTPLLDGADFVATADFRSAAAVLAHARAAVVPEGGLHHACAALGVPAVVLYGGFISPAVTGYESQVSLFTGDGLGCGMRLACGHCRSAMAQIAPETVAARLLEFLETKAAAA